jgi:hypothetical protein
MADSWDSAYSRAVSGPEDARIEAYVKVCSEDSFAVVCPVTPVTIRPASRSATLRPPAANSHAVHTPAMPPPMTATSTVTSALSGG